MNLQSRPTAQARHEFSIERARILSKAGLSK